MATEPTEALGAYELLTKPVQSWSDAEVEIIVADLRRKRQGYLNGVQDKATSPRAKKPTLTPEQKAANTASLLDAMLKASK